MNKQIFFFFFKERLSLAIEKEILFNGNNCDLNHFDVSGVTEMEYLFRDSEFNGDISAWNMSKVNNMTGMFLGSKFNGDISKWDVSNVEDMSYMFSLSKFTGDVSKWDTSSVLSMNGLFNSSLFNGDISAWDVSSVWYMNNMFSDSLFFGDLSGWRPLEMVHCYNFMKNCPAPSPYWLMINNKEERCLAIDRHGLKKSLSVSIEKIDKNKGSDCQKSVKI